MQPLLDRIGRGFEQGRIEFATTDGRSWTLGEGQPAVRVRLRDVAVLRRMLIDPALRFGEAYMDGGWDPEQGDLRAVLGVAIRYTRYLERRYGLPAVRRLRSYLAELNSPISSLRNAAHHYNVDFEVYRRFLDDDLHYSCAYFAEYGMTLEQAQQAKCALIARKLDLTPGAHVLDIGCGWGSLAMYLAEHHGARVTGVTLSSAQLEIAQQRARARGLADHVDFRLQDYRDVDGRYDAIVSVGMFEHVGRPQYQRFFDQLAARLKPDGVALLHTIGRLSPPGTISPWIRKYSGLLLNDLEVWRHHYARTLQEWHRRFQDSLDHLPAALDQRFKRMWAFYLQASEASFVDGDLVVFHAQLSHRLDRLPLTRAYLYR